MSAAAAPAQLTGKKRPRGWEPLAEEQVRRGDGDGAPEPTPMGAFGRLPRGPMGCILALLPPLERGFLATGSRACAASVRAWEATRPPRYATGSIWPHPMHVVGRPWAQQWAESAAAPKLPHECYPMRASHIKEAARAGWVWALRRAGEQQLAFPPGAMAEAARSGSVECMREVQANSRLVEFGVLMAACRSGDVECMDLASTLSANDYLPGEILVEMLQSGASLAAVIKACGLCFSIPPAWLVQSAVSRGRLDVADWALVQRSDLPPVYDRFAAKAGCVATLRYLAGHKRRQVLREGTIRGAGAQHPAVIAWADAHFCQ